MADARVRLNDTHHRKTWRQTPGARTARFGRTQDYICRWRGRLRSRLPALQKPFAPMDPASTAARPACRDDRDTPLFLGPGCATHTSFPKFGKAEYFWANALPHRLRVLPDGQRKLL
jgi:hypothetical protein